MTINRELKGNKLTLSLEGRLDTTTAPELERVVEQELGGVTELVVDLEKLEYISSAGLRVLLAAHKKMKGQGPMTVLHPNEIVMEVFNVTGFTDILTIE